jgi:hypothetical protein
LIFPLILKERIKFNCFHVGNFGAAATGDACMTSMAMVSMMVRTITIGRMCGIAMLSTADDSRSYVSSRLASP